MNPNIRKLVAYVLIGMGAASIDFMFFYLLRRWFGVALLVANTSGVCSGIVFSFCMNRKLNFRVFDHTSRRFIRFASVSIAGLVASNALIQVLTWFSIPDALAKGASLGAASLF